MVEALENICCIQFDTEKYLNISIGDLEIIRMININKFNMNDSNSSLNYMKIKNYDNSNYHFKYCEKAICMMTSTNFLIIFIDFANFLSELSEEKARYDNINLIENRKTSGKILMHNYSVPFDFDGKDFLFVDFLSKEERAICLFDTIKNKLIYSHNISQNFGHISHMKIITYEKIFLVRNEVQCEIRYLNNDFEILEKFEYIGYDILSCCLFYVNNLEYSIDLLVDDESEKNIEEKLNQSNGGKIEQNVLKLFENRNNLVENNKEKTTMINTNQTINKKKKSRAAKNNKYIFNQNLLISNNFEENKIIS